MKEGVLLEVFDFLVRFIYYLIPGMLAWTIFCSLKSHREQDEFLKYAYPFLFSAACFVSGNVIISAINGLLQFIKKVAVALADIPSIEVTGLNEILAKPDMKISNATLYVALAVSICLGYIAVYIDAHHLLFRIANALKITNRKDNDSVWDNVFEEHKDKGKCKDNEKGERWVYYRDHISGKTYYGCVIKWSDKQDIKEVKMQNVSVRKDGKELYKLEYVYLARNPGEFTMEFLRKKDAENGEEAIEKMMGECVQNEDTDKSNGK